MTSTREDRARAAFRGLDFREVTIGDGAWVSTKATVAASVGERAVFVASVAVVQDVPGWALAGGAPARVLNSCRDAGAPAVT